MTVMMSRVKQTYTECHIIEYFLYIFDETYECILYIFDANDDNSKIISSELTYQNSIQ